MSELKPFDLDRFARTTDEIYSLNEFRAKLDLKHPLRIKYGVDVTAPFLHIGHAVNLWMMRDMQECGHVVVFLIGDFTTQIGDPTGRLETRKVIPREEIEAGAKEFIKQVGQILITAPEVFEVRRNSEWYDKIELSDFMSLLSMVTHSRLIQRDMFQKRIETYQEIYMNEMLYPILQGYDSVMLNSDLTIVGTDQLFNELMGRFYQEKFGQSPQIVITTKITPGTDGVQKQSKSLGNFIALSDTPREKFGKIMSIPDSLIIPYLEVYTLDPMDEISNIEKAISDNSINPITAKKRLATAVVERYHGAEVAQNEERWFTQAFSERGMPEDIPIISITADADLVEVVQSCLPDQSRSAIRRLVQQGGVRLNDTKLSADDQIEFKEGDVLKVGRTRWFKVSLTESTK